MPEAVIWGASGGMGQALVRHLKAQGWKVYAAARTPERIPPEADHTYEFNAASPQDFQEIAMMIAQESDGIDFVGYVAGDLAYDKLDRMGYEGWQATLDSNLNGAYLAASHCLNLMQKGGHMAFIGVYEDHIRLPKMGAYAVAKAGLHELVTMLRKENRRMHFTLVRPGAVDSGFWQNVSFKMPDDAKKPAVVAQAIFEQVQKGEGADIDL